MKFLVLDSRPYNLDIYRNCFLLIRDRWNDWFKYKTQCYAIFVTNDQKPIDVGDVKIGQLDMREAQ